MTTRIIITDASGFPLAALEGNHGAAHARRWTADVCAQIEARGIRDPVVLEITPVEGGDAWRREVQEQMGCVRPEFRKRPDGARELLGFHRLPLAARGAQRSSAAATPALVRCSWRLVEAPADVHGPRQPIRVPRGRQNPGPGAPLTDAERRHQRRAARANTRGQP